MPPPGIVGLTSAEPGKPCGPSGRKPARWCEIEAEAPAGAPRGHARPRQAPRRSPGLHPTPPCPYGPATGNGRRPMAIGRRSFGHGMLAAGLALAGHRAAAGRGAAQCRHAAHRVPRRGAEYRPLFQQPAHRPHPWPPGLGRAGASRPESFRIVPALATAWRWVDTRTLDFELRPGVKFHDGSDFGADDVVYTLNTVANPDSRVATPQQLLPGWTAPRRPATWRCACT